MTYGAMPVGYCALRGLRGLTAPPIVIPCLRAMQARDQAKRGKQYRLIGHAGLSSWAG